MNNTKLPHIVNVLKPGGGPAGYLYNLNSQLSSDSLIEICPLRERKLTKSKPITLQRRISRYLKNCLRKITKSHNEASLLSEWEIPENLITEELLSKIEKAGVFVSHSMTFSKYWIKEAPVRAKHYIFNHSPVDGTSETVSGLVHKGMPKKYICDITKKFAEIELDVYDKVNGIFVPCKDSLESYFIFDNDLRKRFEKIINSKRIIEIPTGIPELKVNVKMVKKHGIPENKIIVGYFGRYNPHKGYDIFCDVARASQSDGELFFISAGKENPFKAPHLSNFKDLGMLDKLTELPYYMNLCDIVLIPNRATFFDLVILEAMSLSKCVLTSNTGGNKFLNKFSSGVVLYDDNSPENIIENINCLKGKYKDKGIENFQAYKNFFTIDDFVKQHETIAGELLKNA